MENPTGSGGGYSGDEGNSNSSSRDERKSYHRHTPHQVQVLEQFFKECAHPEEVQRRRLGRDLGMDPKQVKFWFQNKRTQVKSQSERADNTALRNENEKIYLENMAIREALRNVICPSCGGPPIGEDDRHLNIEKLRLENIQLKDEREKIASIVTNIIGKPIEFVLETFAPEVAAPVVAAPEMAAPEVELQPPQPLPALEILGAVAAQELDNEMNTGTLEDIVRPYPNATVVDVEKPIMLETAACAMEQLVRVLRVDEPFWIKSGYSEETYVIHVDSYDKIFPRATRFKSGNARIESSKCSGVVSMNAQQLVDMFLDAEKWMDLFPTIVTDAKTIQVIEAGMEESRNGCLLLMHQEMHILSPLVPLRELFFLRFCQQLELGTWVIMDVSYNWGRLERDEDHSASRVWKLPSGCMIQDLCNGSSKVTWVEHMEVDDKAQIHRLYRDVISKNTAAAYGAEKWMVTLQRMCEKLVYARMDNPSPARELGLVVASPEGRKGMMKLGHRMVKIFCRILKMSGKLNFPQLSEVNNSGVRVSVRKVSEPGQPDGIVLSAATSLWLPLPPDIVFNYLRDIRTRKQWDTLCSIDIVQEIASVSNGAHPGNCLTVMRPYIPNGSNLVMFQESYVDNLGSMVIYAPVDIPSMNQVVCGGESWRIPVLPSGLVISGDGRQGANSSSGGSLLTVALQFLISLPEVPQELDMEIVATAHTLISSTVQRIKAGLNCSELEY